MKIVALVPFKANSERVPGKNFRELNGKPLYRWIIDTLLSMGEVSTVVINTDAEKRLRQDGFPSNHRVLVRHRSERLRGDLVSMNLILEDDIESTPADVYLMTHVTNPLLSATTIRRALEAFHESPNDSLFTVNRFQTRFFTSDAKPINHSPHELLRTQDLEPWYEENSCLYLFTRESFARTGGRIGSDPMLFETPRLESVDIDEPEDWILAEALSRYRGSH